MNLTATIHIGASTVSMLVMSPSKDGDHREVDYLEKPLPLARDIFGEGRVSRSTIEQCVRIIQGFQKTLAEMGGGIPVRAVTNNNLSEASNSETFINRLRVACQLPTEALDDGEMTRLVYLKTRRRLHDTPSMRKRNTLVVHIGPGNTRVLFFQKGHIIRYNSYRLGTHRTSETIDAHQFTGDRLLQLISAHTQATVNDIYYDYSKEDIEDMVLIGHEVQLLAPFMSKPGKTKVSTRVLEEMTRELADAGANERVQRYQLDYQTAEASTPALAINLALARVFNLESVRVPGSDYERGLLGDLPRSSRLSDAFEKEVLRSARNLGSRYGVNPDHADHVATLCKTLFDSLSELHALPQHDAFLLETAALLHECGGYIAAREHERHSEYIILNSEIFGLSHKDKVLVALLSRYHRGPSPKLSHAHYRDLDEDERIRVSKLASLLRMADALERTHSQRIKGLTVSLSGGKCTLHLKGVADANPERLAMRDKGKLFEDIFGLSISLTESN